MIKAESDPSSARYLATIATAGLLAIALLGFSGSAVLAGPESGVDVVVHDGDSETGAPGDVPTACTFHLHFLAQEAKAGAFDIHEGDEDGPIVDSGLFDTTATGDSRAPETGVFELPDGEYTIVWDDEIVRDRSHDEQAIVVFCDTEEPPPPSGSEEPIESDASTEPSGEELPVTGTPTGGVAGVTVTPPATDVDASGSGGSSNALIPIAAMLGLAGLFLTSSLRLRQATVTRSARRHRRR